MNILEDCLLRHIFSFLEISDIKKISSVSSTFYNLNYRYQCIPHGIYKWIYGIHTINKEHTSLNLYCLTYDYSFLKYIKDIIYFLEDITIYRDTLYYNKSYFITCDIGNKTILKHRVYGVSIDQYYRYVINSHTLKGLIY